MSNSISKGLLEDKLNLQSGQVNRASAIYPIFDLSKTDLIISFQNYWEWKKGISVSYLIRLRSNTGELILQTTKSKPSQINNISLKELLRGEDINHKLIYEGTAEIEINSSENLSFPYPAILGIYKSSNGMISIVHAAGRSLDKIFDEEKSFSETNFYISDDDRYKPFIHIFNGSQGSLKDLKIEFKSRNSKNNKIICIPDLNLPYESKLIFIDNEIVREYKNNDSDNSINFLNCIVKISGKTCSIFPRFVCGNFDTKNSHYCVTHTYREINNSTDVLSNVDSSKSSIAVIPFSREFLDLKMLIYPTTSSEKTEVTLKNMNIKNSELIDVAIKKDLSIQNNTIFLKEYDNNAMPGILLSAEPANPSLDLPARIPVNLMYGLSESMNTLPTDIAFQMSTHLSTSRKSHWHNGIFEEGYSYLISGSGFTSKSLNKSESSSLNFLFELFVNDYDSPYIREFSLDKNEARLFTIEINQILEEAKFNKNNIHSFAWRIKVIDGTLTPLICLAYNRKLGCIYGEHSF